MTLKRHKVGLFVDEMSENRLTMETSFTANQDCKSEEQRVVRCKKKSCLDRLRKRHAFPLWHILLFLFVVAAIIVSLGLLSPGVLGRKKTPVRNGRKYNKKYNVQHKAKLVQGGIEIIRLNFGS